MQTYSVTAQHSLTGQTRSRIVAAPSDVIAACMVVDSVGSNDPETEWSAKTVVPVYRSWDERFYAIPE